VLKIGDLSRLAQVSVKTLRYYGDLGLLVPEWIDRYTGYRYYAPDQLARLNRILALKDLGFTLEQIRGLLDQPVSAGELHGMLRLRRAELERTLSAERARLLRVEARLRRIDREGRESEYPVVLKTIGARQIHALRARIPGYGHTRELLERLGRILPGFGTDASAPPMACYLPDAEGSGMRVEVGVPVEAGKHQRPVPEGLVLTSWKSAPEAATALYPGDPEGIAETYAALLRWSAEGGYRASGPSMELYIHGPREGLDPEAWLTEVRLPVVNQIDLLSPLEKEKLMNPEIKTLPTFTVMGQVYRGRNEHGEIPAMWNAMEPRWPELEAIRACEASAYGVCAEGESDGIFEYLAGVATEPTVAIPEGMNRWTVPARIYAVFPCLLSTIHETYHRAHQIWLPTSGYRRASGPDLELYPASFDDGEPSSEMYVYIPIERQG